MSMFVALYFVAGFLLVSNAVFMWLYLSAERSVQFWWRSYLHATSYCWGPLGSETCGKADNSEVTG